MVGFSKADVWSSAFSMSCDLVTMKIANHPESYVEDSGQGVLETLFIARFTGGGADPPV